MTATVPALDRLSRKLWSAGVAGFCATTLSSPPPVLLQAVERLGAWIKRGRHPGARPLGIHLEGPFISPHACGAHPPGTLRPLRMEELEALWKASQGTLKILTIAPETLQSAQLKKLVAWSGPKKIHLSLGHSHASEEQARQAFRAGFNGVTHAWNALPFHHRAPGVMGAALGDRDVWLELILDQVHVAPALIRFTQKLHDPRRICVISDGVPAAGTPNGSWHAFGPLRIALNQGACRLKNGALAGGGLLLPQALSHWARQNPQDPIQPWIQAATVNPLRALAIPASRFSDRRVRWQRQPDGGLRCMPVTSLVDSNQ